MMYYARNTPADMLLVKTLAVKKMEHFRSDVRYFEFACQENYQANLRNA